MEFDPLRPVSYDLWKLIKRLALFIWERIEWRLPRRIRGDVHDFLHLRTVKQGLKQKFPDIQFYITKDYETFSAKTGKALVQEIEAQLERDAGGTVPPEISVGIVCGPMVYKLVRTVKSLNLHRSGKDYSRLRFVALNRAAESESFHCSANYLVTRFAQAFPGSKPIAYTFNPYDKKRITESRSIQILLCSAGCHPQSPPNYLKIWCDQMTEFGVPLALPEDCIGDFCLIPITRDGKCIDDVKNHGLLTELFSHLEPHPRFERLSRIKSANSPVIILPMNVEGGKGSSVPEPLTGKEEITKTILRSGIVNTCVLERKLAKNLARSIGDFLIEEMSMKDPKKPVRAARGKSFRNSHPCEIHIFDPHARFDSLNVSVTGRSLSPADLVPKPPQWIDIVVSEFNGEDHGYDHASQKGRFNLFASASTVRHDLALNVDVGVRKPGKFALATIHAAALAIEEMRHLHPDHKFKIWDLGCGCGVVGFTLAQEFGLSLSKVLFTDIRQEAIECTEHNLSSARFAPGTCEVRKGDLFAPAGVGETHDLIVFNVPFLPEFPGAAAPDVGGTKGVETAIRYCEGLFSHLLPGGHGILTIADYVDQGQIMKALQERSFEEIRLREQVILYPTDADPPATEIDHQIELEEKFGYKFEHCILGSRNYRSFRIRVYDAKKPS